MTIQRPYLGFGLGLRSDHYPTIMEDKPTGIDWFEIISENFMVAGGKPLYHLDKIRSNYPIVMHGVSMSIAGNHDIDYDYLDKLKNLIDRVQPAWV
ncbi:MAG: multinuclear nonheme iron-dependent oxidase, partial [Ostreibacterium sp.]